MSNALKQRAVWLALGVGIGLAASALWPAAPLHAVATAGQDNFAIATGSVDIDTEAVFFLDSLTGDLKGSVLSPLNGKFTTFYNHNIINDLAIDVSKNPQFLMVTGVNNFRRTPGSGQLGSSVLYVAEVTSGKVVAYGIPWSRQQSQATRRIDAPLVLLDGYEFRNVAIRDE